MAKASKISRSRSTSPSAPWARTDAPRLVWLYAVVEGRVPVLARVRRLPHAGPPRALPLDRLLTAIVADVPADHYGAGPIDAHLAEMDWVAACGAAHHAVIARLARTHAVAPFRMLTIFASDERLKAALAPQRVRLRAALARLRGRAEWVVRVFRPSRPAEAAPAGPITTGTEFLKARRDRRAARSERAQAVARGAVEVARSLADIADAHVFRPVSPDAGALVDAAYLVHAPHAARFRRSLAALSRDLRGHGCRVTVSGPWPPYSFVALEERMRA